MIVMWVALDLSSFSSLVYELLKRSSVRCALGGLSVAWSSSSYMEKWMGRLGSLNVHGGSASAFVEGWPVSKVHRGLFLCCSRDPKVPSPLSGLLPHF